MNSELSRTITTCAIWLATAIILTFGLFRMNGDAFFFLFATGIIAGAAAAGTAIVWYSVNKTVPGETLKSNVPPVDPAKFDSM